MIGAYVFCDHGRAVIIDTQQGHNGETEYLLFLENPIVWGPDEIYSTYWAPNETAFEVLSDA